MAWVAVHKNGEEGIYLFKPNRFNSYWYDECVKENGTEYDSEIPLPKGSIKKLIGRDLTWEDNPVELSRT